jgi:hypothetical protein
MSHIAAIIKTHDIACDNYRKVEPRTLKFKGSIKGKNITILVDSGSTHNFVDINLAKQLNIFVYLVRISWLQLLMVNKSKD